MFTLLFRNFFNNLVRLLLVSAFIFGGKALFCCFLWTLEFFIQNFLVAIAFVGPGILGLFFGNVVLPMQLITISQVVLVNFVYAVVVLVESGGLFKSPLLVLADGEIPFHCPMNQNPLGGNPPGLPNPGQGNP